LAIRLRVRLNKQIVVPIRFARAVSGVTREDAPDVDDRGFAMGARPGTWGTSDARGAMVSIQEGDVIQVKVLREDIESAGELFVTSTNPAMADIEGPAGPLGADGVFSLKGVKDSKNVTVKIQVHLGSAEGPVLGELEPHIFQLRELRVRAHIISINPPATGPDAASTTAHTPDDLVGVFDGANRIYRAAGLKFLYNPSETRRGSISGFRTQGTMTTNLNGQPPEFGEFSRLINLRDTATGDRPDPNAINVYFIRNANEVLGLTFDHDEPRPSGFGVIIADSQGTNPVFPDPGRVTAHELGHYLDNDVHADQNAAGTAIRADIVSRRRLMFSGANIRSDAEPPYRRNVGYGNLIPGTLITVKDFGADPNDGEVARNRRRSLNPN
jgi:hypothetical protein